MRKRRDFFETISKSDPNYEIYRRFYLESLAETCGLPAGRASFSDCVEAYVKLVEQAAAAHMRFETTESIAEHCRRLDKLSNWFIRKFTQSMTYVKSLEASVRKGAIDDFTSRVREISGRTKKQIIRNELARIGRLEKNIQPDGVPEPEGQATGTGQARIDAPAPRPRMSSLSKNDNEVHERIGERNFRTLTNAEILRDRDLRKKLPQRFSRGASGDAMKCCLDRIRNGRGYPLSRDIAKKRSSRP